MADVPKKTIGKTVKATGGQGVALTARQALQAAEKATAPAVKPAPTKAVAAKPAATKAAIAKPAAVKPAVVEKAKEIAAKAPVAAPVAEKVADKPVAVQAPAVKAPLDKAPVAKAEVPVPPVAAAATAITNDTVAQDTPTSQTTYTTESAKPTLPVTPEGTKIVNDVIANTKKYTDEAKTRFQSAFADMNEKAKTGVEKSTKAIEEMADIAKGNVEAMVESGKIAAKGVEAMGQDAAEYGRMTFEKASATMKSLAAAKSPTEFFQLQSEMMSSAFDAFAKESAKTSEALIKLAGEVAQPLSSRVSLVTDKVKSLAA